MRVARLLVRPGHYTECGTAKTGPVSESSNTLTVLERQEFEVVEAAAALNETAQRVVGTGLILVNVREVDVAVYEGKRVFRQLLQSQDERVTGCGCPCA